ncbi:PD40 domain-containing protein [Gemmata sp. G18]|uniref:PD40 domain-containing protein n=1 Tax=Gemmata palustris TaxID=2822762 RepID=A0ABS5BUR2_9BACT|nr:PD40 domain-containing protein [Gemmata palustris]MBP3957177.1 PD40 domain-containing protein [Gemmata palustris]
MRQFNTPAGEVRSLRFAPDGRSLYLLSKDSGDWRRLSAHLSKRQFDGPEKLADQFDESWLGLYRNAYRVDVSSGAVVGEWQLDGSEVAIFAPGLCSVYHSVSVAVAGGELDLRRLDLQSGRQNVFYQADVPYPRCLSFTPNGHILAIGGYHHFGDHREYVHRLDVWHKTELDTIQVDLSCLAYSLDGRLLATGGQEVQVWYGRKSIARWTGYAGSVAWSPDGRLAWANEKSVTIAHPTTVEPLLTWDVPHGEASVLVFSACGRFLVTGSTRGSCTIHDPNAGAVRGTFDWGIGHVHSITFSPDGLTCAAGGENGRVIVWDVDG